MNLDEFITNAKSGWPKNQYVEFEGFDSIYVRFGRRYIGNVDVDNVLDIANLTASHPGSGAFTRMIRHLESRWPELTIYVECVLNERFANHLACDGWHPISHAMGSKSFILKPMISR